MDPLSFDNIFAQFAIPPSSGGAFTPEDLAASAAVAGIPPPQLPENVPLPRPAPPFPDAVPDVGASLSQSVPLPRARPREAGPNAAALEEKAAAPGAGGPNALLDTLRGIKPPVQPETPKMGANAPAPPAASAAAIKGGQLQQLLAALQLNGGNGLKLPVTLNTALGGR